jgi:flagellar protein FliO/FliZ
VIDTDTLFLLLRVVVALGVVVALLWIVKRRFAKGGAGKGSGSTARRGAGSGAGVARALFARRSSAGGAALRGRHALGQKSSVAVVEFDGREFLLGVTEQGVTVLHASTPEAPKAELEDDVELEELEEVVPEQVAPEPAAAPSFAQHLTAAQLAPDLAALDLVAPAFASAGPVAQVLPPAPAPAAPTMAPAPAFVSEDDAQPLYAPRYARHGARVLDVDEELPSSLAPEPVPVRHVVTGTFVAEVELLPMPAAAAPVPPVSAPVPPTPVPPAPRAHELLPTTAMIPTVSMVPVPRPAPAQAARFIPEPVVEVRQRLRIPAEQPQRERAERADVEPDRRASPLAGSILSPDTWRQTVDALRSLR